MPNTVVALPHESLATIAPNYEAMRQAIAKCERVDEIAKMADLAVAAQAYYRQSLDVENEMNASRIRVRAERRMGELLNQMKQRGERDNGRGGDRRTHSVSRGATLNDLGIPRDRASRAMQLADVPEAEFEAALGGEKPAQPRRILREIKGAKDVTPKAAPPLVPIEQTLDLWGSVRNFGEALESGHMPPLALWRTNMQPFQVAHLRRFIPPVIEYLSTIYREIEA